MDRRVVVEIDLKALVRNYRRIAAHVKPVKVLCVLKANAYGLGVAPFARALGAAGCRNFGVAEPYEALELAAALKAAGVRDAEVQILSSVLPDEVEGMVRAGVTLPVTGLEGAKLISSAATKLRRRARVHFKLDTGMGRLGILATGPGGVERALAEIRAAASLPGLDCEGIFSHCPVAYEPKNPFTPRQIALFKRVVAAAGVLTLKTRVAQVRELPAGTTLGYGRTWCLASPSKIATISAGYADGLPLALTNRGFVFIGGRRCPIVGRISMDYATVDVTGVEGVKAGDEVICFGRCGNDAITPDDWAALKGTHAYDIICSLGNRVQRVAKG